MKPPQLLLYEPAICCTMGMVIKKLVRSVTTFRSPENRNCTSDSWAEGSKFDDLVGSTFGIAEFFAGVRK